MVNVVLALGELWFISQREDVVVLTDNPKAFSQDHQLVSGKVIFFDSFPNDLLRYTIGVYVGGVPLDDYSQVRYFPFWLCIATQKATYRV